MTVLSGRGGVQGRSKGVHWMHFAQLQQRLWAEEVTPLQRHPVWILLHSQGRAVAAELGSALEQGDVL